MSRQDYIGFIKLSW